MFDPSASASTVSAAHGAGWQMAIALRARVLSAAAFPMLSRSAAERLRSASEHMAMLIQAGEDVPEGMNLRSGASFLLCTLSVLRVGGVAAQPLSALHEAWMLEEVECELGDASALFEMRTRGQGT
jgi:hypothetical protein